MLTAGDLRARALARLVPLDADVLVAHALGISKEELYAHPERGISDEQMGRGEALIARREAGEPVAYLRGWKEFYGLRFEVDPRVLIPRPETETLVDAVRKSGARVVADVGTGSGAIAVALAVHEPDIRVIATDVSPDALAVARANAGSHRVLSRIELREGDLLAPVGDGEVDCVAANLPYLTEIAVAVGNEERSSLAFEPEIAVIAGPDGLGLIRRAVAALPRVLRPGGAGYFECDPPQARALASELGAEILRDLAGNERVLVVRPEGGRAMMAP